MNHIVYGETAFHHEGNIDYLYRLIDLAAETQLHGIKFQILIDCNDFMSKYHRGFDKINSWTFTSKQWNSIIIYAKEKGLLVVAMPCDTKAADFIHAHKAEIDFCEVHSINFNDERVLDGIKKSNKPVILSCGGRTIDEIVELHQFFDAQTFTIMHGYQSFPSDIKEIGIGRIQLLKKIFPQTLIGYADHTGFKDDMSIKALEYAYLLGARVFEKHITLDEGEPRTDFEAAVGKQKIIQINHNLNLLRDIVISENHYRDLIFSPSEVKYRNRQKKVVARQYLYKGTRIDSQCLALKMTESETGFTRPEEVIGSVAYKDFREDEIIEKANNNE